MDKSKLDYRPTPKQRSVLELLQYTAAMGPTQVAVIKSGVFNRESLGAAWGPADAAAKARNSIKPLPRSKGNPMSTPASWEDGPTLISVVTSTRSAIKPRADRCW